MLKTHIDGKSIINKFTRVINIIDKLKAIFLLKKSYSYPGVYR